MIKTILFDFDGVILDSMKIKGDGFMELFKEYPKEARKQLEAYHYANGGISRFEKIRYFFNHILSAEINDKSVDSLANAFAKIIKKRLNNKENLIVETMGFIEENHLKYNLHIVSGAEHNELNNLCDTLSIRQYFKSIDGSPVKKDILIKNLLKKHQYKADETILIGDSINDWGAARANDVFFYGFNNINLRGVSGYIDSFRSFSI
ncbi:MAG: HAD family hydrolase [Campylobacterales bacterium]|nr:HAD family hydrolase [Campylobacterales bacterium]